MEKEKLEGDVLDPKEARTELSTFWPKLNVTPELFSSVVLLLKENKAAAGAGAGAGEEEEEAEDGGAAGGGGEAVVGRIPVCFSSEPPSAELAPYWRSMLARCCS